MSHIRIISKKSSSRWWFQIFFIFTPTWGRFQFWRAYFSNGLVQPSTRSSWSISETILPKSFPNVRCPFPQVSPMSPIRSHEKGLVAGRVFFGGWWQVSSVSDGWIFWWTLVSWWIRQLSWNSLRGLSSFGFGGTNAHALPSFWEYRKLESLTQKLQHWGSFANKCQ